MTVVVLAAPLANKPGEGGSAWITLSWLHGLRALGIDVHLVETLAESNWRDDSGAATTFESSVGRHYFADVVRQFGLEGQATLLAGDGPATFGLSHSKVLDLLGEAALLVNISGHLRTPALLDRCRRRAYVDLDPGFTQVWHAQGLLGNALREHDALFTVGRNVGTALSTVPTDGLVWHPIWQPVGLSAWPVATRSGASADPISFSTVARWRPPYGRIKHDGVEHGTRPRLFRQFVELPRRVDAQFAPALAFEPADDGDRRTLMQAGWDVANPSQVAATTAAFQAVVQASDAEIVIPQGAYASLNTGWFGDRSTRYLASGKPVLMLDTGLSGHLPTGDGLVTFTTLDKAVEGARRIVREYDHHARAARQLAARTFDDARVLGDLLTVAGVGG